MPLMVHHDYQITLVNPDLMALLDSTTSATIVTAARTAGNNWLIHSDDEDDATVSTRADAVAALKSRISAGVVLMPHGIKDIP
jgi:hypothetical protein